MLDAEGQPILVNREQIEQEVNNLAKQGLRVLAFAKEACDLPGLARSSRYRNRANFFRLAGHDRSAVQQRSKQYTCQSAGIQVKMITGDHVRCTGDRASDWFEKESASSGVHWQ